jgi:hypothetical protein
MGSHPGAVASKSASRAVSWLGRSCIIVIVEAIVKNLRMQETRAVKLPQSGGCQCSKVRYEITEAPQLVYTCHCKDCQRLRGSAFRIGIVVPENGFRLSGIEPRLLHRRADSGRTMTLRVCPECGCSICGLPNDGVVRVLAGTLDDTSWVRSSLHVWTRSKQPWVTLPEGDQIFEAGRLA